VSNGNQIVIRQFIFERRKVPKGRCLKSAHFTAELLNETLIDIDGAVCFAGNEQKRFGCLE